MDKTELTSDTLVEIEQTVLLTKDLITQGSRKLDSIAAYRSISDKHPIDLRNDATTILARTHGYAVRRYTSIARALANRAFLTLRHADVLYKSNPESLIELVATDIDLISIFGKSAQMSLGRMTKKLSKNGRHITNAPYDFLANEPSIWSEQLVGEWCMATSGLAPKPFGCATGYTCKKEEGITPENVKALYGQNTLRAIISMQCLSRHFLERAKDIHFISVALKKQAALYPDSQSSTLESAQANQETAGYLFTFGAQMHEAAKDIYKPAELNGYI